MSEIASTEWTELLNALRRRGLEAVRARQLLALNLTMPVLDGEEWVILDESGSEVLRIATPTSFLS